MSRSQVNTSVFATEEQIESINSTNTQGERQFMERFEQPKQKKEEEPQPQEDPFSWFNAAIRGLAFIAGLAGSLLLYNFFFVPRKIAQQQQTPISEEAEMYKRFREEAAPPPYVADSLQAMEQAVSSSSGKEEMEEEDVGE